MTIQQRIKLADKSLTGVSIGDAFGESFFRETNEILKYIRQRKIPPTSWEFTDDTVMAIAVCDAAYNLHNYEEAIWKAVSILGDRDTICAIVGGITIMSTDEDKIPKEWLDSVEDFRTSGFIKKA